MDAKAKINLKEGLIELEGSEDFVGKYLDHFKDLVDAYQAEPAEIGPPTSESPTKEVSANTTTSKAKKPKPSKTKNISPEKFDIHKDGKTPSLQEFYEEKSPGSSTGDRIAVIGYYIQYQKKLEQFTEGNIDYAYRMLKLTGKPKHLHQIMINNKNQKDLFEQLEGDGIWKMTRTGEIFVEEELPPTK